jgi:hypothetical protein
MNGRNGDETSGKKEEERHRKDDGESDREKKREIVKEKKGQDQCTPVPTESCSQNEVPRTPQSVQSM